MGRDFLSENFSEEWYFDELLENIKGFRLYSPETDGNLQKGDVIKFIQNYSLLGELIPANVIQDYGEYIKIQINKQNYTALATECEIPGDSDDEPEFLRAPAIRPAVSEASLPLQRLYKSSATIFIQFKDPLRLALESLLESSRSQHVADAAESSCAGNA